MNAVRDPNRNTGTENGDVVIDAWQSNINKVYDMK